MSRIEEKTRAAEAETAAGAALPPPVEPAPNKAPADGPASGPADGTPPKPKRKGCRRFLWGTLAGLILGLAALAGGVWYLLHRVG